MSSFTEETIRNISQANAEPDTVLQKRLDAFKIFQEAPLEKLELFKKYAKHDTYDFPEVQLKQGELEFEMPKIAERVGVMLLPIVDALGRPAFTNVFEKIFNNEDKFSAFANAFFNSGYLLYVPDDVQLLAPIVFKVKVESPVISKGIIIAGLNSSFAVFEEIISNDGLASVYSSHVDVFAEEGSNVNYTVMQDLNTGTLAFLNKNAYTQKDSSANFYSAIFGGAKVRTRTSISLQQPGTVGKNFEIIFGNQSQRFDLTSKIHSSAELTKGESHSRGLFSGKSKALIKGQVIVEKGAKNSDTYLTQHGMLLSKDASANAIPCLEIQEQDVRRATHSASVAPIDEEHIFYLSSRGLANAEARKLIVVAFLETLLKNIQIPEVREKISQRIEQKFGEENV